MQFLPRKFRENSLDWFGKRGVSWHISMVYRKRNGILERLPYIHIFPGQVSQDASITVAIILDVISSLVRKYPTLHEINLWLDNGGCYKSSETMPKLFHHTTHVKPRMEREHVKELRRRSNLVLEDILMMVTML